MIRSSIFLFIAFASLTAATVEARSPLKLRPDAGASTAYGRQEEILRCEKLLVEGRYCYPEQAEIVCSMVSLSVAGCAMDLVDMKQFNDIFDALEYCRSNTR